MLEPIARVEVYEFRRERDDSYLGTLDERDVDLGEYHFIRHFNGTVYPTADRSVVLRVVGKDGVEGWGETYGLVAPRAVAALIGELFAPYLKAGCFDGPADFWDKAYALQRVRGYWGGYLADALAALDIALWDLEGKRQGKSIQALLGRAGAGELPCYISGLPAHTTADRVAMAQGWQRKGFDSLKIPVSATDNGDVVGEIAALREALGPEHKIALDLHWTLSTSETLSLANNLAPFGMWFLEAPTAPEDIDAQRAIAAESPVAMALGEEWRTDWDLRQRLACCAIVQPEMGHTGITQFMRIARLAAENGKQIIPHATIGLGIFQAASLRASLAAGAASHEFQHTIYHRNAALMQGMPECEGGRFVVPDTPGHGATPKPDAMACLTLIEGGS